MKVIKTNKAPKAIGPYSQGISFNNYIFTSGQIPIDPKSGQLIRGNFKKEVIQVLKNLDSVLKESGSSLKKTVKLTVFLTDLSNFSDLNEIFTSYFDDVYPARSAVQVAALPLDSRVEIEAIGII